MLNSTIGGDDMVINKAYKLGLYPNTLQKETINKTFGCTRLVYNHYLNKKQELYKNESKNISAYDCIKDLSNLYITYPYILSEQSNMLPLWI